MHKKYAKDGLVALSVSVDKLVDEDSGQRIESKVLPKVLAFLKQKEATLTNLLLDEPQEFWKKKLGVDFGVPVVFVFNRQGKWVRFKGEAEKGAAEELDYAKVEDQVKKLLKE